MSEEDQLTYWFIMEPEIKLAGILHPGKLIQRNDRKTQVDILESLDGVDILLVSDSDQTRYDVTTSDNRFFVTYERCATPVEEPAPQSLKEAYEWLDEMERSPDHFE